jgi:hypothetical protein
VLPSARPAPPNIRVGWFESAVSVSRVRVARALLASRNEVVSFTPLHCVREPAGHLKQARAQPRGCGAVFRSASADVESFKPSAASCLPRFGARGYSGFHASHAVSALVAPDMLMPNHALQPTAASALRLLAVPSSLRSSAAAEGGR